jgi:hypothetical protein
VGNFALEVMQDGNWVHKGDYSSLRLALQSRQGRFLYHDARIINRETGEVHDSYHFNVVTTGVFRRIEITWLSEDYLAKGQKSRKSHMEWWKYGF